MTTTRRNGSGLRTTSPRMRKTKWNDLVSKLPVRTERPTAGSRATNVAIAYRCRYAGELGAVMTINPGTGTGVGRSTDSPPLSQDTIARLARAYMATYRGPHGDAPGADSAVTGPVDRTAGRMMSPALVDAHLRLGR